MSLKADIDRGLEIQAEMEKLKKELKAIAERIEAAALRGPQIPLEDAERDGTQFLARGTARIVPVVITADFLHGSFTGGSKLHTLLRGLIGEPKLADFYAPKTTYERVVEDGKAFRQLARATFEGAKAEMFITACVARDKEGIPKSAIKIEWKRAKESEVAA